jgi:hypothetical protein
MATELQARGIGDGRLPADLCHAIHDMIQPTSLFPIYLGREYPANEYDFRW